MKRIYTLIALLLSVLSVSAQGEKQLTILHTSDTHSRIEAVSPEAANRDAGKGGVVRRATYVKQVREAHPDLLLFDCGDISQGTPYYNLFQGEVEIKAMNLMKYDAMAVGNHEFDFGMENMARLFRMANFPVVCANYEFAGTVLEELVKPYVVLERQGLKIGVFGLGAPLSGLVQADKCEGVVYKDPIATAQQVADKLKNELQCDLVICLSHLGIRGGNASDERLVAETRNIDLILGGHSHTLMQEPATYLNADGQNVKVFHSGRNGVHVGELSLTLIEK